MQTSLPRVVRHQLQAVMCKPGGDSWSGALSQPQLPCSSPSCQAPKPAQPRCPGPEPLRRPLGLLACPLQSIQLGGAGAMRPSLCIRPLSPRLPRRRAPTTHAARLLRLSMDGRRQWTQMERTGPERQRLYAIWGLTRQQEPERGYNSGVSAIVKSRKAVLQRACATLKTPPFQTLYKALNPHHFTTCSSGPPPLWAARPWWRPGAPLWFALR